MFGFYKSFEEEEREFNMQYLEDTVEYNQDVAKSMQSLVEELESIHLASASLRNKVEYILSK